MAMMDVFESDKGNISLPPRLQSPKIIDGQSDDPKQVMILNMQKAVYQVRISDITKRIQTLQSRNDELEESCTAERLLYSKTDVQTADKIAHLNRQIFSEMAKITDHQKRIQTVQKWMENEKQTHLDNVESANKKYAETRVAITSEIAVLNAKINSLEEYKASKSDLCNKLIAGNNLIAQRDQEAKQRCEQIQRKFKIGKEKMKKEMYARLQGLAGTFQMEVAASITKPIHRLMRENIFIKNELINIVRESVPKKEKMKEKEEMDDKIIRKTTITKKHTVQNLITSKIQGCFLAAIKEQHTRVKDCLEKLRQYDRNKMIQSIENTLDSVKVKADEVLRYISRLETDLHREQTQLGFLNYLRDKSKIEVQRCTNVLDDAMYAVTCSRRMNDTGKNVLEMGNRELMIYLLDILSKGDTQKWQNRTPSLATVPSPEEAYRVGDLGFEVSHTKLRYSTNSTVNETAFQLSTSKILAGLENDLLRVSFTRSQIEPLLIDIINQREESKEFTDETTDQISGNSSLSLSSQQEPEEKIVRPEAVVEEKPETHGEKEGEAEEENQETEEEVARNQSEV